MALLPVDAQGTKVEIGTTTADPPVGWAEVLGVLNFKGLGAERPERDRTTLKSTAREYGLGLKDQGNFEIECLIDYADAGQDHLRTMNSNKEERSVKLTLSNNTTLTFRALVKSAPLTGGLDEDVKTTFSFRVTGDVTEA